MLPLIDSANRQRRACRQEPGNAALQVSPVAARTKRGVLRRSRSEWECDVFAEIVNVVRSRKQTYLCATTNISVGVYPDSQPVLHTVRVGVGGLSGKISRGMKLSGGIA